MFKFNISARDTGYPVFFTSYVDVSVYIKRVNEYTPQFQTMGTSLTIPENSIVGSVLYSVSNYSKEPK